MEPPVIYLKEVLASQLKKVKGLQLNIDSSLYELVVLFMLIESIANILTVAENKKSQDNARDQLLKELSIKYPQIVYKIFRNPLAHLGYISSLQVVTNEGKFKIVWAFANSGMRHSFHKNLILININKLKNDLISFLEKQIELTPDDTIFTKKINVFNLNFAKNRVLKEEILKLMEQNDE